MRYRYARHFTKLPAIVFISACICLLAVYSGRAETVPAQISEDEPWHIKADKISYDPAEEEYVAEGNVVITHLDNLLEADRVHVKSKTMIMSASGNVFFTTDNDTLSGDHLVIDLVSETGTLYKGTIFIEESNFYIAGDRIQKTGKDTYYIKKAELTSCELDNPDWSITGSDVNVTVDGYGTVKHAAFRVRRFPVFYVPFFVFPAKTKRQSGLLPPHIEYSSKNGFGYIQPMFWAISDHSDATLYYHHLQRRGEKAGLEYRYVKSGQSRGTVMFDGFEDRKIDDDPDDPDRKWGYPGDGLLRPNSDRYWFRAKADQKLPGDFMARLDLDFVSDQDYLRDFDTLYTGHQHTNDYFESEFDRGIDDRNERVRENRLNINRNWRTSSFNAGLIWNDDVVARRQLDKNETLQRLPMIHYNIFKQPFYHNRVYGSINNEYNYFFREDGVTGHRADLHPRLYFPFYPGGHFTFEPSVGYRQTAWYTDADRSDIFDDDNIEDDMKRYTHRGIYDIGAELSTDVHSIFPVSVFGIEKIKHGILPRLRYSYIPGKDQSGYPDFDEIDRIEQENLMTFSMTHLFTSRRTVSRPDTDPEPFYNMFARFLLEQPYDFDHDKKGEAFLPLYAELDITPVRLFGLHANAQYSHQRDTFISSNTSLRLRNLLGSNLRAGYRYTKDTEDTTGNKTLFFRAEVPVKSWLDVYGDYERSLTNNITVELNAGIRYKADCWSADLSYRLREDFDGTKDESYYIMIQLYGLGEFGN